MIPKTLAKIAKSPWTYVALFAALVSLAGGFFYQAVQPSGVVAVEPTPWPDDVPQRLPRDFHPSEVRQVHPTDASREAARNCPTGSIGAEPGGVWRCLEQGGVRPLSESEIQELWREKREKDEKLRVARASATPVTGALIKLKNGKPLQLPDDVYVKHILHAWGQVNPVRVLSNGASTARIDGLGRLPRGTSESVLDEFGFLREFQEEFSATIQLDGRDVELPDTFFILLTALDETDVDGPSPQGVAYPVYAIGKRTESQVHKIVVDANGKLIPGASEDLLDEFPFLKQFQDE